MNGKPILCLDFDGVIHAYTSGWKGADTITDGVVPGALEFIGAATDRFRVCIFSSRSNQKGGLEAMQTWLMLNAAMAASDGKTPNWVQLLEWPLEKPPALLTIDDRAITFEGTWPTLESIAAFKPWNKRQ